MNISLCRLTLLDWGLLSLQFAHYVTVWDGACTVGQTEDVGDGDPEFELCFLDAEGAEHRELPASWPGPRRLVTLRFRLGAVPGTSLVTPGAGQRGPR